jgi:hypothetical protein
MADTATFLDKVRDSLSKLVTLDIQTVVGHVSQGSLQTSTLTYDADAKILLTRVNLLEGDSTTVFPPELLTDEYQSLRAFHTDQVKEGHAIIQGNIAALEKLLALVKAHLQ